MLSIPTVELVVEHLLRASQRDSRGINLIEIYRFLDRQKAFPSASLDKLRSAKSVLLRDAGFVAPNHVFWKQHPFGRYRHTIGDDFLEFKSLLTKLGVALSPNRKDAISVLLQIEREFGAGHTPLDE